MTSDELAREPAALQKRKSRLGIYLLVTAWAAAWGLVIAQIALPPA